MNYFVFSGQFKKGMQIITLLAILLFSLGPGGVFSVYAAPTNDNFASATVVTTADIPYIPASISTVAATIEANEPPVSGGTISCASYPNGEILFRGRHSVWYKFMPTANAL